MQIALWKCFILKELAIINYVGRKKELKKDSLRKPLMRSLKKKFIKNSKKVYLQKKKQNFRVAAIRDNGSVCLAGLKI